MEIQPKGGRKPNASKQVLEAGKENEQDITLVVSEEPFLETSSVAEHLYHARSKVIYTVEVINHSQDHISLSKEKARRDVEKSVKRVKRNSKVHLSKKGNNASETVNYNRSTRIVIQNLGKFVEVTDKEPETTRFKRKRRKIATPDEWRKNKAKMARLHGNEFTDSNGKNPITVKARAMKPSCNCKNQCFARVTEADRKALHSEFWARDTWEMKRLFLVACITETPKKTSRPRLSMKNREFTRCYEFSIQDRRERVCKTFFQNTLVISDKFLENTMRKQRRSTGGVVFNFNYSHWTAPASAQIKPNTSDEISEDARSLVHDHIKCFPTYRSHYKNKREVEFLGSHMTLVKMYELYMIYCVERGKIPLKFQLYELIFCEDFEIEFKFPYDDICETCEAFQVEFQTEGVDAEKVKKEYNTHLLEADSCYKTKLHDIYNTKTSTNARVVTVDLEKCMATPKLSNSESWYKHKLWTYNLSIHDSSKKKTHCILWDESIGGRGGDEVASGILSYIKELPANVNYLIIWSDSIAQNKNINLILMYMWVLQHKPSLKMIEHKYFLKGHVSIEGDADHAHIEQASMASEHPIYIPQDWTNFIASCRPQNPFCTHFMGIEQFLNFASLCEGPTSPLVVHTIAVDLSDAVWIRVENKQPFTLKIKNNFSEANPFTVTHLRRKNRRKTVLPTSIPPISFRRYPIAKAKWEDLQEHCPWIPSVYHHFYESLPYNPTDLIDDDFVDKKQLE